MIDKDAQLINAKAEIKLLRIALADAIVRPKGVIPDSAAWMISCNDLREAECRVEEQGGVRWAKESQNTVQTGGDDGV